MEAAIEHMTVEEFLTVRGERRFAELVDGVMVISEPRYLHLAVQNRILFESNAWCRERPGRGAALPPADVLMSDRDLYAPDVVWYAQAHLPPSLQDPLPTVPDLAVEVRSPSTWRYDIGRKKTMYERGGLPELWLVDTDADEVLVFRRSRARAPEFDVALELAAGDTVRSPLLSGFKLEVGALFEP